MTGFCARRFGLPWQDAWDAIAEQWESGVRDPELLTGFSEGWRRVGSDEFRDLDVLVFGRPNMPMIVDGVGFVLPGGLLISARPESGVFVVPVSRMLGLVDQIWRAT